MLTIDGHPNVLEYFFILGEFENRLMQNLIIDAIAEGKLSLEDDYMEVFERGVSEWSRKSENIINFSRESRTGKNGLEGKI